MPLISYRGGTYEGEINSAKLPHGQGTLKYTNGDFYKGQWQNGKPNGKGQAKGTIDEKKASLWKKFTTAALNIQNVEVSQGEYLYDGEWKDGKMHGHGMYTFPNGDIYDGEWQNNVAQGTGMYIWHSTNNRYQGFWRNMAKHGSGTYCFKDGTKFDGVWANDKRHGRGTEQFANGNRYDGYWVNDKRHGTGFLTVQKSKENKRKSLKSSNPKANNNSAFTVYEQIWENGVKKSEKEIDAIPSTFPEPPVELKDSEDLALEDLDKIIAGDKFENDNVFVEAIIQWPDSNWKMIEEQFLNQIKTKFEVVFYKQLQSQVELLNQGANKVVELQAVSDKLTKAVEANNKKEALNCIRQAQKIMDVDEELPSEDASEDIFKMQLEVKHQNILSEIAQLKKDFETSSDDILCGKDIKARQEELNNLLTEAEKKIFRVDASLATAKLHASAAGTSVKPDHPNYEELAKTVAHHLSRLRELIKQVTQEKLANKFKDESKSRFSAVFERVQEKFKSTIVNLQDKASVCGASPSSIIERAARIVKMTTVDL